MFNKQLKKEINSLLGNYDKRIIALELENKELRKLLHEPRCYALSDMIPENSILELLGRRLQAVTEYLKIEVGWEWQDDPNCIPPETPKIRVWKAYKKK